MIASSTNDTRRQGAAGQLPSLSAANVAWLPIARLRRSQEQKIARHRRDDPAFPWRCWGKEVTNETMAIPGGVHFIDGERVTWATANAATALCYGRNAPFATLSDVPPEILAEVEAGAAEALAVGAHLLTNGAALGRAIGMTWELREELKCWLIWPAGATSDDLSARREARAAERKAKDRIRKQQQRRAKGMANRTDYETQSIAADARKLGLKPDTLRARLRRAAVTPCVASVSAENIYNTCGADRPATERYTLAQQARELGISPGALRVRLHRERQRQAALESAAPVTLATEPAKQTRPVEMTADAAGRLGAPPPAETPPPAKVIPLVPRSRSRSVWAACSGPWLRDRIRAVHGNLAVDLCADFHPDDPRVPPSPEPAARTVAPMPEPSETWCNWWERPLDDWRNGKLIIRNLVSDVQTVIDLREGCP
jgi:hypothetical protein